MDNIKRHYQSSGASSQGSEGSVVCSSILTSTIKGVRKALVGQACLCGFGFYHHQVFKLRMLEKGQSNQQSCEGVTDRVPDKRSLVM